VEGTTYLSKKSSDFQYKYIQIKDQVVVINRHELQYISITTIEIDYGDVKKQTMKPHIKDTQNNCQQLTEHYIEFLIDSLRIKYF